MHPWTIAPLGEERRHDLLGQGLSCSGLARGSARRAAVGVTSWIAQEGDAVPR